MGFCIDINFMRKFGFEFFELKGSVSSYRIDEVKKENFVSFLKEIKFFCIDFCVGDS